MDMFVYITVFAMVVRGFENFTASHNLENVTISSNSNADQTTQKPSTKIMSDNEIFTAQTESDFITKQNEFKDKITLDDLIPKNSSTGSVISAVTNTQNASKTTALGVTKPVGMETPTDPFFPRSTSVLLQVISSGVVNPTPIFATTNDAQVPSRNDHSLTKQQTKANHTINTNLSTTITIDKEAQMDIEFPQNTLLNGTSLLTSTETELFYNTSPIPIVVPDSNTENFIANSKEKNKENSIIKDEASNPVEEVNTTVFNQMPTTLDASKSLIISLSDQIKPRKISDVKPPFDEIQTLANGSISHPDSTTSRFWIQNFSTKMLTVSKEIFSPTSPKPDDGDKGVTNKPNTTNTKPTLPLLETPSVVTNLSSTTPFIVSQNNPTDLYGTYATKPKFTLPSNGVTNPYSQIPPLSRTDPTIAPSTNVNMETPDISSPIKGDSTVINSTLPIIGDQDVTMATTAPYNTPDQAQDAKDIFDKISQLKPSQVPPTDGQMEMYDYFMQHKHELDKNKMITKTTTLTDMYIHTESTKQINKDDSPTDPLPTVRNTDSGTFSPSHGTFGTVDTKMLETNIHRDLNTNVPHQTSSVTHSQNVKNTMGLFHSGGGRTVPVRTFVNKDTVTELPVFTLLYTTTVPLILPKNTKEAPLGTYTTTIFEGNTKPHRDRTNLLPNTEPLVSDEINKDGIFRNGTVRVVRTEASTVPFVNKETSTLPFVKLEASTGSFENTEPSTLPFVKPEGFTVPWVNTETSALPFVKTEASTLPFVNTETSTLPFVNTETITLPFVNTETSTLPFLKAESRTVPFVNTETSIVPIVKTGSSTVQFVNIESSSVPVDNIAASNVSFRVSTALFLNTVARTLPLENIGSSTANFGNIEIDKDKQTKTDPLKISVTKPVQSLKTALIDIIGTRIPNTLPVLPKTTYTGEDNIHNEVLQPTSTPIAPPPSSTESVLSSKHPPTSIFLEPSSKHINIPIIIPTTPYNDEEKENEVLKPTDGQTLSVTSTVIRSKISSTMPPYVSFHSVKNNTDEITANQTDQLLHNNRPIDAVLPTVSPPQLYIVLFLTMTTAAICSERMIIKDELFTLTREAASKDLTQELVTPTQVALEPIDSTCKSWLRRKRGSDTQHVTAYVTDVMYVYNLDLTRVLAGVMYMKGRSAFNGTHFFKQVEHIKIMGTLDLVAKGDTRRVVIDSGSTHIQAGSIAAIVVLSLLALAALAVVSLILFVRWRRRGVKMMRPASARGSWSGSSSGRPSLVLESDTQNLAESIQMQAFARRGSRRYPGHANVGLQFLPEENTDITSNPLMFTDLERILRCQDIIDDEFLMLPGCLSTISDLPDDVIDKNRYANIIPNPETRVSLEINVMEGSTSYINANFVKGYQGYPKCYIATQAPLEGTVYDLWRMVWEQQSEVIVMLTAMHENRVERCHEYWPNTEGGDTTRLYGEFRVSQERRIVMPEWIQTTLTVKYKKAKQNRVVQHFWLTAWPPHGLPDYRTVIKFMVKVRPMLDHSAAPAIVHCSSGTGRTGVFIALDICMLSYEDSQIVNVLNTVYQMRKDRGGMVQTKEQYVFIYKVVYEFAKMLDKPCSSVRSSMTSTTSSYSK